MYAGITPTKFGQYRVAEALRLDRLHFHDGGPLREVDHEPPVPVLDQEDLNKQGIDTSQLVPGARRVDALGSCTCNSGIAHVAERVCAAHGQAALASIKIQGPRAGAIGLSTSDPVADEECAILLYHLVTWQTGNPVQEWPPTDCGSTGLFVCEELERQGIATGHKSAHTITDLVSLLQAGSVMKGAPWFEAWMEPDRLGFVDGQGTLADLENAIRSGIAGGHETTITAVERLVLTGTGAIDPFKSHVRIRNSWSASWGDHGSYRIRLSTLQMLGAHADFKQITV